MHKIKLSNFLSKYTGKMRLTGKLSFIGVTALGIILGSSPLVATNTTFQTVTFSVSAINELSVSGNPGTLTISAATAGSAPNSVSDATTTYSITTNESTRKITAAIDVAMPSGTTLTANLVPPVGRHKRWRAFFNPDIS